MNEAHTRATLRPHAQSVVVLVGHGGVPRDFPQEKVRRLMSLEKARQHAGAAMGDEERALDTELRTHPRTPETDPYQAGLERVGRALQAKLGEQRLLIAYNEFCAPSVEDAVRHAVQQGATEVTLISAMMTPGGSHSEQEIPEIAEALQREHPALSIRYAWPFDLDAIATLMADQLARFDADSARELSRSLRSADRR